MALTSMQKKEDGNFLSVLRVMLYARYDIHSTQIERSYHGKIWKRSW